MDRKIFGIKVSTYLQILVSFVISLCLWMFYNYSNFGETEKSVFAFLNSVFEFCLVVFMLFIVIVASCCVIVVFVNGVVVLLNLFCVDRRSVRFCTFVQNFHVRV